VLVELTGSASPEVRVLRLRPPQADFAQDDKALVLQKESTHIGKKQPQILRLRPPQADSAQDDISFLLAQDDGVFGRRRRNDRQLSAEKILRS
jgi:hypothetical protein